MVARRKVRHGVGGHPGEFVFVSRRQEKARRHEYVAAGKGVGLGMARSFRDRLKGKWKTCLGHLRLSGAGRFRPGIAELRDCRWASCGGGTHRPSAGPRQPPFRGRTDRASGPPTARWPQATMPPMLGRTSSAADWTQAAAPGSRYRRKSHITSVKTILSRMQVVRGK